MSGNQIACRECRQQKVRCTGRSENGDQCRRCMKRGLECIVDNNFKRTIKRKAVEALEAEIADLKAKLRAKSLTESSEPQLSKPNVVKLSAAKFEPPRISAITPVPDVISVETWYCEPKTSQSPFYEKITLDSITIKLLFREYVMYYHRILPVVEVQRGPEFVYGASAALFWTIIAIASRRRSSDLPQGINFERLCEVQKHHLSEIAVSPVLGHGKSSEFNLPSLYAVQAFILCTLWPPPTASINADMSWNTSGIAVLTAIRAGLHCPGYAKDFERIFKSNKHHRTNMREQLVTWLATNALSQVVANMFGYPSSAIFRAHHHYLFHNIDLPPRVRHMYEIQRNAHDIEQSLGLLGQSGTSFDYTMVTSLIRIHAARYDHVEAEFGSSMDSWTLFTLHAGRAQLFSYYLFTDFGEESALALYNSCLALLNHVVMQPKEYMKYLPVVSIMILWQTSSIIAKLYFSKWSDNLDKESGERLYRAIIKRICISSVFEHDLPYRAAEIMTQMWGTFKAMRMANHDRTISAKLALKSRMAASVFFDCLWQMREGSEIRSHAPTKLTRLTNGDAIPSIKLEEDNSTSMDNVSSGHNGSKMHSISSANEHTAPINGASIQQQSINPTLVHRVQKDCQLQQGPPSSVSHQTQHPQLYVEDTQKPDDLLVNSHSSSTNVTQHDNSWRSRPMPSLSALLSPDTNSIHNLSHSSTSPISPALSTMIDSSWSDINPDLASTIWRDVDAVMEDFGFGLSELPYISP